MNDHTTSLATRVKVGLFSFSLLLVIGLVTMWVNDKPEWWKPCQLVYINVDDALGLKTKSPIRTLGLQIGYLRSVELADTYVRLGICITANVEILPTTRAYIKGEGFLGDKFVELRPVIHRDSHKRARPAAPAAPSPSSSAFLFLESLLVHQAYAQETSENAREIPIGDKSQDMSQMVEKVDVLVNQLNSLTTNLKQSFNPGEFRGALQQLNKTLENANRNFSPAEGSLTSTAQRTLAKLEDAIEQLRDMFTRVNQGKGSLGILLNDPTYAEEVREAIRNINKMLGKVGGMRLIVDMGAEYIPAYGGSGRGYFGLTIAPSYDKYYLIGLAVDPRGDVSTETVTTTTGGVTSTVQSTRTSTSSPVVTAQIGKILFDRFNIAGGIKHSDGTITLGLFLGRKDQEDRLRITNDLYIHNDGLQAGSLIHDRVMVQWFPINNPYLKNFYLKGGMETFRTSGGIFAYSIGAGISFDDQDIKVLFAFL